MSSSPQESAGVSSQSSPAESVVKLPQVPGRVVPACAPEFNPTAPTVSYYPSRTPLLDQSSLEDETDEERALLYLLRLVSRPHMPGSLSPVERAFVEGAKVMFDHLAKACHKMLNDSVADYTPKKTETVDKPRTIASKGSDESSGSPKDAAKGARNA